MCAVCKWYWGGIFFFGFPVLAETEYYLQLSTIRYERSIHVSTHSLFEKSADFDGEIYGKIFSPFVFSILSETQTTYDIDEKHFDVKENVLFRRVDETKLKAHGL